MYYIDPVCKKKLRKKEEFAIVKYGEHVYHLCCKACKDAFDRDPSLYALIEEAGNCDGCHCASMGMACAECRCPAKA